MPKPPEPPDLMGLRRFVRRKDRVPPTCFAGRTILIVVMGAPNTQWAVSARWFPPGNCQRLCRRGRAGGAGLSPRRPRGGVGPHRPDCGEPAGGASGGLPRPAASASGAGSCAPAGPAPAPDGRRFARGAPGTGRRGAGPGRSGCERPGAGGIRPHGPRVRRGGPGPHGHALAELEVGAADRLFSIGDPIDRGPDSSQALSWIVGKDPSAALRPGHPRQSRAVDA